METAKGQAPNYQFSPELESQAEGLIKKAFELVSKHLSRLEQESAEFEKHHERMKRRIAARGKRTSGRVV
jgi:hypothetical protein